MHYLSHCLNDSLIGERGIFKSDHKLLMDAEIMVVTFRMPEVTFATSTNFNSGGVIMPDMRSTKNISNTAYSSN